MGVTGKDTHSSSPGCVSNLLGGKKKERNNENHNTMILVWRIWEIRIFECFEMTTHNSLEEENNFKIY